MHSGPVAFDLAGRCSWGRGTVFPVVQSQNQKGPEISAGYGIRLGPLVRGRYESPFVAPKFENNVILTGTGVLDNEHPAKNPGQRPKSQRLYYRLVRLGKDPVLADPQLLQAHSSYVVVDPKGGALSQVGHFLQKRKGYKIKVFNSVDF